MTLLLLLLFEDSIFVWKIFLIFIVLSLFYFTLVSSYSFRWIPEHQSPWASYHFIVGSETQEKSFDLMDVWED